MKQRIRSAFGEDVPGVEYLAIVATDSQARQENATHLDRFTVDLRSLLAMQLVRTSSPGASLSPGVEKLLSPQWTVEGDETRSRLFASLLSTATQALAGAIIATEALRELTADLPGVDSNKSATTRAEVGASEDPKAAGAPSPLTSLRPVREMLESQARGAVSDFVIALGSQEAELGPVGFSAPLRELKEELEAILTRTKATVLQRKATLPRPSSTQGRSQKEGSLPQSPALQQSVAELLALQAFATGVSELLDEVGKAESLLNQARERIRRTIGSDLSSLNLVLSDSGWSLEGLLMGLGFRDQYDNPISPEEMAIDLYKKLGLSAGIVGLGISLQDSMDSYCRDQLKHVIGSRMVLRSDDGVASFVQLESDEYVLLSPDKDLDPQDDKEAVAYHSSSKDTEYYYGYSRRAANEALWEDENFKTVNDRISKKIISLTSPRTEIRMNEILKKSLGNLSFDTQIVRIMVLGDSGDTLSGALLLDVAGMAVQHCQSRGGGGWRAIAIISAPHPAIGYLKNAFPQAKACATLKEIYYWWEQNKYQKVRESKRVQVDTHVFNAIYLLQNIDDDPGKAIEHCAAAATELALLQTFDDEDLFLTLEDGGRALKRPVLSFGAARLVCPKDILAKYDSYSVASEAVQAFTKATDGGPLPQKNEEILVKLRQLVEKVKDAGREGAEAQSRDWWEQFQDVVGRSLDEGPIDNRLASARMLVKQAKEVLEQDGSVLDDWDAEIKRRLEGFTHKLKEISADIDQLTKRATAATLQGLLELVGFLLSLLAVVALLTGITIQPWSLEAYQTPVLGALVLLSILLAALALVAFHAAARTRERIAQLKQDRAKVFAEPNNLHITSEGFWILRGLYRRIVELERQLASLEEALYVALPDWRKRADDIRRSLPMNVYIPDTAGTVSLVSPSYLAQQLARVRDDLLDGSLQKGFGVHCKLKLRPLLGLSHEGVAVGLPAQIERLIRETHREDFSAFEVLALIAHPGDVAEDRSEKDNNTSEYIHALKIASKPSARYNPAKIDGVLGVKYIMALEEKKQADEEPLKSARITRGVPEAGQSFHVFTTVDPSRIVLCQVWSKPIDIGALEAVVNYTEAFENTPKYANLGLDLQMETARYSLVERVVGDSLRALIVRAIVLGIISGTLPDFSATRDARDGQYSPPAGTTGLERLVELYRVHPERAQRLKEAVEKHIASVLDREELVAWLTWVKNSSNYRKRIGLTESDVAVIDELIEQVKTDRKGADFI